MATPKFEINRAQDGSTTILFSGEWRLVEVPPSAQQIIESIKSYGSNPSRVSLAVQDLGFWDSSLVAPLYAVARHCASQKVQFDYSALPLGLRGLLKLALAVPRRESPPSGPRESWVSRIGATAVEIFDAALSVAEFLGDLALALSRLIRGKAHIRKSDFLEIVEQAGPSALSIVSLISILVGLIFAYIGAVQLRQFGAEIYVANLVGLAMTREMAGVMAGIILAGRTGAAFAAQLGTMQVNEEIDALMTLGISPMESLVLPRMIALVIMIPLLCLYAMVAGILGGTIVSVFVLDISLPLYFEQTINSVHLNDVWVGVFKSLFFGALVALCGCYYGIRCGRSASAVGQATTSAVVSGIVCVVVADAVFAILCDIVGV